ncbi:MAG: thioredoxin [Deltaproteobacteria bacterium]|nr:MAG: thioredoxin [Deltaproteobacteria bacterium]
MEEVMKDTFDQEVIQSDRPVVVDFWGPQCGPCLALMPAVEALAEKYGDRVKMVKLEAPKNRRLCLELKVLSLPTYLFYKDGKECHRLTGTVTIESIEESIKQMLGIRG